MQHVINANRNKFIPRQMVRVQKQVAAPSKGRHGKRGVDRTVAEGSRGHSSVAGGSILDRRGGR